MRYYFFFFLVALGGVLSAQCPQEAGLYCNPDVPDGAPVLCDIDCLDGFEASMPDSLYSPQPNDLCDNGGSADNMSWFAFVAGSDSISLTVTPSGCNRIFNDDGSVKYSSIQAGIMGDCDISDPDVIACYNECSGSTTPRAATIEAGGLIPGKTYFFYVDGCGGTVCDYRITVNFGNQPFSIAEPDSLYSTQVSYSDTICTGITALDFTLGGVDSSVNYNWRIQPATDSMPDLDGDGWGELASQRDTTIYLPFLEVGTYTVMAFADNDCDQTDSFYFSFVVDDLDPIVFDSVEICGSDFPYLGPFQDGVGWMTGQIFTPGLQTGIVEQSNGCSYEESVFVTRIGSARAQVELNICSNDYPITFDGIVLSSAADAGFYTLGTTVDGCDSLIEIVIIEQAVYGAIVPQACTGSSIQLEFRLDSTASLTYDSIRYQWFADGVLLANQNAVDTAITVAVNAVYSIQATVYTGGTSCTADVSGNYTLDLNALQPGAPLYIDPITELCVDAGLTMYAIATDGTEQDIAWYVVGDPLVTLPSSQNVEIDWSLTAGTELCVSVSNDCGVSDTVCIAVTKLALPQVDFSLQDTICDGEELVMTYIGDPGVELSWNTDGGTLIDLGNDQYEITWTRAGLYTVGVTGTRDGCSDTVRLYDIVVEEIRTAPAITCTATQDAITFSWTADPCAVEYIVDTSGVEVYRGTGTAVVLQGLPSSYVVAATMRVVSSCDCYSSTVQTASCMTNDCPSISLDIDGMLGTACMDDMNASIDYTVSVLGSTSAAGVGLWTGPYISQDGIVPTDSLEADSYTFVYTWMQDGCTYADSVNLQINDSPELVLDVDNPDCYDDESAVLNLDAVGGLGPYTFFINGSVTDDITDLDLLQGDYDIEVVDDANCGDQESINISIPEQPDLLISGSGDIIEGNSDILSINVGAFVNHVIDSILWSSGSNDDLCPDCQEVVVSPSTETSYLVTVFFDNGCSIEDVFLLSVRPETMVTFANVFNPISATEGNRFFKVASNNPSLMIESMQIYDRWGQEVYAVSDVLVSDYDKMWDGRFNGSLVQQGVYVYTFRAIDDEQTIERSGTITILR